MNKTQFLSITGVNGISRHSYVVTRPAEVKIENGEYIVSLPCGHQRRGPEWHMGSIEDMYKMRWECEECPTPTEIKEHLRRSPWPWMADETTR